MSIHTYTRRYALFLTGVILSATGIAFITRAGLGTSPVSGLPFVLSLKPFFAGNLPSSRLCRFR